MEAIKRPKKTREVREGYYSELARNRSYKEIMDVLNDRQRAVYEVILKDGPIYSEAIAERLGIYPHQVSPRVQELRWMKLVEFDSMAISTTYKKEVCRWRAKHAPMFYAMQEQINFGGKK